MYTLNHRTYHKLSCREFWRDAHKKQISDARYTMIISRVALPEVVHEVLGGTNSLSTKCYIHDLRQLKDSWVASPKVMDNKMFQTIQNQTVTNKIKAIPLTKYQIIVDDGLRQPLPPRNAIKILIPLQFVLNLKFLLQCSLLIAQPFNK